MKVLAVLLALLFLAVGCASKEGSGRMLALRNVSISETDYQKWISSPKFDCRGALPNEPLGVLVIGTRQRVLQSQAKVSDTELTVGIRAVVKGAYVNQGATGNPADIAYAQGLVSQHCH